MAKKNPKDSNKKEEKKESESVARRKKKKAAKKKSKWSGLILFLIMFLVGFVLWISGEVKNRNNGSAVKSGGDMSVEKGVIIIE